MPKLKSTALQEEAIYYGPSMRYWFYALAGALIALLFARELVGVLQGAYMLPTLLEKLLFLLVGLGIFVWGLYTARSRVLLTHDGLIWQRPMGNLKAVQFRQLISASQVGRLGHSLALLYHPIQPNGLLDLDDARSLFLPAVDSQDELLAKLQEQMPT